MIKQINENIRAKGEQLESMYSRKTKELIKQMKSYKKQYFSFRFFLSFILLIVYVIFSIIHLVNNQFSWIYVLIIFMFVATIVLLLLLIKLERKFKRLKNNLEKIADGFILLSHTTRLLMLSTNIAYIFTLDTNQNGFEHLLKVLTFIYLVYALISFISSYKTYKQKNLFIITDDSMGE